MITLQNFSPHNRSKTIGNSLYRICREKDNSGQWYIYEAYNNKNEWCGNRAYHSDDLQTVIDKFNSICKEKEIISLKY